MKKIKVEKLILTKGAPVKFCKAMTRQLLELVYTKARREYSLFVLLFFYFFSSLSAKQSKNIIKTNQEYSSQRSW